MTIRRIKRFRRQLPVSDACLEAFREWRKLAEKCECDDGEWSCRACLRRRELNSIVHDELQLSPWMIWYRDPYWLGFLTRLAAGET